mmetsp:Transcript_13388/g.28369  ORF Transcript_13388/g.28369 Transcript_13388/m.28369 type:complete len:254 (-) Transcript_13388:105-866(-)|eukprot:CAMPEP_0201124022 /NCGR_PEP_ID=MMETSP0850-20130426/10064_1 /ASSEMBLY_ACC=CAM_ASM_000622 /TAXON_ID=183588 /ORGANISM="Pseudo-nitzschia fraudulenta, Strain WWA7" /LENGTH=253 /DNA_ID=CAMNT_0047391193 /DNA_START=118 /DNA_END=879 /DNA_ORIENTATION=-
MAPIVEETRVGPQTNKTLLVLHNFAWPFVAVVALIIGTAANFYCETVKFAQEGTDLLLLAGPFTYKTNNDPFCANYNDYKKFDTTSTLEGIELDAGTITVRVFACLMVLLGGLTVFAAGLTPLCGGSTPGRWRSMGASMLLTSIFQGLTLLVVSSSICYDNPRLQILSQTDPEFVATLPDECEWAVGFETGIAATVLWFLAGLGAIAFPPPIIPRERPVKNQTVTYQQNMDGTVQETHVTIVKGTPVPEQSEA